MPLNFAWNLLNVIAGIQPQDHRGRRSKLVRKTIVLKSINLQGGARCLDIFMRPDGTFGFEEFRRDIEDARGWFPIGFFGDKDFESEEDALREARSKVAWLNDVMNEG